MSQHFTVVLWVSIIFLIIGGITLTLYLTKRGQESKESLLGVTVMLLIFGALGLLFSLVFSRFLP
ncbi:type II toxin-antitoxin system toxin TsaT [Staphylococcus auricularis]|uniref:type II toxin-antitoxin system toxin TsaT n=1 Tax=Staphylococcus auricularis TaxID=29379 RepID=UPI00242D2FD9|nr:hypothetical protein [Staphylococcus auricularis]